MPDVIELIEKISSNLHFEELAPAVEIFSNNGDKLSAQRKEAVRSLSANPTARPAMRAARKIISCCPNYVQSMKKSALGSFSNLSITLRKLYLSSAKLVIMPIGSGDCPRLPYRCPYKASAEDADLTLLGPPVVIDLSAAC